MNDLDNFNEFIENFPHLISDKKFDKRSTSSKIKETFLSLIENFTSMSIIIGYRWYEIKISEKEGIHLNPKYLWIFEKDNFTDEGVLSQYSFENQKYNWSFKSRSKILDIGGQAFNIGLLHGFGPTTLVLEEIPSGQIRIFVRYDVFGRFMLDWESFYLSHFEQEAIENDWLCSLCNNRNPANFGRCPHCVKELYRAERAVKGEGLDISSIIYNLIKLSINIFSIVFVSISLYCTFPDIINLKPKFLSIISLFISLLFIIKFRPRILKIIYKWFRNRDSLDDETVETSEVE